MKMVVECIGDIGRSGSTIFSTLDLSSGFWQLPLKKIVKNLLLLQFTIWVNLSGLELLKVYILPLVNINV
jgi:hypothetical protein